MKSSVSFGLACSAALAALASGCGGDDITCGDGTRKSGSKCVALEASGGSGGMAGGGGMSTTPTFAGVKAVAPASEAGLLVAWDAATDSRTAAEDMVYNVYVATASGEQNFGAPQLTTGPGALSVIVPGVSPGNEYFVVVRARNEAGLEDDNTTEASGTPAIDTSPPTFSGAVSAMGVGATEVEVSWDAASDDLTPAGAMSYTVFWATSPEAAPTGRVGAISAPGASSTIVKGLPAAETEFFFTVRAGDAAGNTDDNSQVVSGSTTEDVTAPTFGGCTGIGSPGATNVTVSWDAAKDDVTQAEDMVYRVYAFNEPVTEETQFGAPAGEFVGGTFGEVENLAPATQYYFVCHAADESDNEETNRFFRTTTTLTDGTPPDFGGITKVTPGSTSATLSWDPATDDQSSPDDIVYVAYASTVQGMALMSPPVAQSNPGVTELTIDGLETASTYYFVVRARDKALNESTNETETRGTTLVSFNQDVQAIFTAKCNLTGCHTNDNPPQGLSLAPGFSYFNLVDVNAIGDPSLLRVDSSTTDPSASYLYRKITGENLVGGNTMPPAGNPPLVQAEIDVIIQWITEGAANN